ncbi:MAG: hypothetical protein IPN60_19610 [Saprospiraceae bacterium]|nr:hypothetical protein [Candidatus Opimibacter skivensis]
MSELQQQLKESIQELETIRKVSEHTAQLRERLAAEEKALLVMETTLAKEQRDVETLESEGLTSMFRKFIGDREEKLEKEREEYLRASCDSTNSLNPLSSSVSNSIFFPKKSNHRIQ